MTKGRKKSKMTDLNQASLKNYDMERKDFVVTLAMTALYLYRSGRCYLLL
jgi:hypothetical protein